jgi:hypothetical protein
LADPKTPVLAKGAPKASGASTSKGRPRKKSAKETEAALVSPLGAAAKNASGPALTPLSSDAATGDDVATSVVEENRILRERLAKAECKLGNLYRL